MKRILRSFAFSLFLLPAVAGAGTQTFADDFEGGTNIGNWHYNPGDVLESSGGNPGWWLHNEFIDNFAVIFVSSYFAPQFTGDWRAINVTNFTFDARLFDYSVDMPMTLLLRNTHGTPNDFDDDDYAYYPGAQIPPNDGTWTHYDFAIPSQDTDPVPAGWVGGYSGDPENFRPGVDWNDIVTQVDRVEIWFWHPAFFGIFTLWNAGLDNVAITTDITVSVDETSWGAIKSLYRE